jgi:DNA-binding MarR family transcriptional regulator
VSNYSKDRSMPYTKADLVEQLRGEIRRTQVVVAAVDQAVGERLGVNPTDHRCLDILDQQGPVAASRLAATLGLSRSAVTTVIDRLERLGYVRRAPNQADRRQVLVSLTPGLRRRARTLYGDGREVRALLDDYTVDELKLLADFCRRDRELNERRLGRLARARQRDLVSSARTAPRRSDRPADRRQAG